MYSQLFFSSKGDMFDCWYPCIQERLYLGQQTPYHLSTITEGVFSLY